MREVRKMYERNMNISKTCIITKTYVSINHSLELCINSVFYGSHRREDNHPFMLAVNIRVPKIDKIFRYLFGFFFFKYKCRPQKDTPKSSYGLDSFKKQWELFACVAPPLDRLGHFAIPPPLYTGVEIATIQPSVDKSGYFATLPPMFT